MTERQHGETETRLAGFEARIQDGFAWANDHGREIVIGIAVFLVVGGIGAGIWEWQKRNRGAAEAELARIEARFTQAMGSTSGDAFISEPANAEQAAKAREAALVELDTFIAAQKSSPVSRIASLRAAEIEVDLGRLDVADKRLDALAAAFDAGDAGRAVALRLRGYVLDQSGNPLAAAEVYETGAGIESYPPRVLLFIAAGDCFSRAGQPARAIAAYRQALSASPEVAEQEGIVGRMGLEQAKLDAAPPPAPAPASDK